MPEVEITSATQVLDDSGQPFNFGWARSPHYMFDSRMLKVPLRSISESDRYVLFTSTHMIVFEILDDGYLGCLCLSILSLKDKKRSTFTSKTLFPLGSFELPKDGDSHSIKFRQKKNFLNFAVMEEGIRIIKIDIPKFNRRGSLRGQIVLTPPPGAQSLYTHMPWRDIPGAFCLSRCSPWYSVEGVIQFGPTEIVFTQGGGWGIFDWNRGVRPPSDVKFWASGCGRFNGRQAGFNLGNNSADPGRGTENAFFLEGQIHKLEQVNFHIPSGPEDPWRFTSTDKRLEMTFTPKQERNESHQVFFYSLKRRQLFGSFSGRVILDSGDEFAFQNLYGMAERRRSRW